jgi:signal peptidase
VTIAFSPPPERVAARSAGATVAPALARRRALRGVRRAAKPRDERPVWRKVLSWLVTLLIIAGAVFLWPERLGGSTSMVVVRGTSMEPGYHVNDVVIARKGGTAAIGDIVVFEIPGNGVGAGMLVVHRLIGVRDDGTYVTQGDNRDTPDSFPIEDRHIKGEPILLIPKAGWLVVWASQWWVVAIALGLIAALMLWPREDSTPDPYPRLEDLMDHDDLDAMLAELNDASPANTPIDDAVMAEATAWLDAELASLGLSTDPADYGQDDQARKSITH